MTPAQTAMYFGEFGKLRAQLVDLGWSSGEIEAERHKITRQALGVDKSSKDFTNADLDAVLARIKARTAPADFNAQMRIQESPEVRRAALLKRCDEALWSMFNECKDGRFVQFDARTRYIAGTARNMFHREPADCTQDQLRAIMGAIEKQAERAKAKHREHLARLVPKGTEEKDPF